MPILKNARWELFAQNIAKGLSTPEAYVAAGFSASAKTAHPYRLLAKDSLKQRIAELQTRNIAIQDQAIAVTTKSLMREAEEARVKAMELGQTSAAIQAIVAKGKLGGVWVERSEQTTKGDLNSMSDDELLAIARQGQPEPVQPNHEGNKKLN